MIKAIILDVDGVLVGGKPEYNWPDPHPDIIKALKTLRQQGIFVSLCTGKGTFAIKKIVESAHLNNLHIGDGGAVVLDMIDHRVIEQHTLETPIVQNLIKFFHDLGTYVELYTLDGYFVQQDHTCHITEKHSQILYQKPNIVPSLLDKSSQLSVVKVMPVAKDVNDKSRLIKAYSKKFSNFPFQWGFHPTAAPLQFGIITAPNISKKQAARTISKSINVPFNNILGIGDSLTDWEFIQLCGYAGVMGNASQELKDLASKNKKDNCFIGPSVDENGVLRILKHFQLRI